MDGLGMLGAVGAMVATAIGATWALRTKLGDIELALREHVVEDKLVQKDHDARIIKLEGRRKR